MQKVTATTASGATFSTERVSSLPYALGPNGEIRTLNTANWAYAVMIDGGSVMAGRGFANTEDAAADAAAQHVAMLAPQRSNGTDPDFPKTFAERGMTVEVMPTVQDVDFVTGRSLNVSAT